MSEQTWERFLSFAGWLRAKPTFDSEERDSKLPLAAALREVLEVAGRGGAWQEALRATPILRGHHRGTIATPIPLGLTSQQQGKAFRDWALGDGAACMEAALGGYLAADVDPVARFAGFEACASGLEPATTMAFGSMFNFAVAPVELPFVRIGPFRRLAEILGFPAPGSPLTTEYEGHLTFANEVARRMRQAGIPVRDMLDVQSLLVMGARFHDMWVEPDATDSPRDPEVYLSVCAIYRDEAPYLREWLEFHRVVGVERFYLYDNGSIDEHREVLAPYVNEGTVVLNDWPGEHRQLAAYEHCAREHWQESRWIAFLDLDEFLFSPDGTPLSEILREFERFPAVGVNWAMFGPSGHSSKPDGLVTESYARRLDVVDNRTIDTIADPARVRRCLSAHHFSYDCMAAVDENGYPINSYYTKSVSFDRLRVNHYFTKSLGEYRARSERTRPDSIGSRRFFPSEKLEPLEHERSEHDEAILVYLPALRERLAG